MREKLWILVCIWAVLLCGSCLGRFVVEKNSLKVTSPGALKGVYECAIGNFGVPQYGGTLVGTVVYPQSNQKACKSFDDFGVSFKSKPGRLPVFVLADRGGNKALIFCPPFFFFFLKGSFVFVLIAFVKLMTYLIRLCISIVVEAMGTHLT